MIQILLNYSEFVTEKLKNYKINQYIQRLKNILQRELLMNLVTMQLNHSVLIYKIHLNDEISSRWIIYI